MAEGQRMTAASEAVEQLMRSEHVDVLREGVALEELTPRQASLEDAFMALTGDSVDFHASPVAIGWITWQPTSTMMTPEAIDWRERPASACCRGIPVAPDKGDQARQTGAARRLSFRLGRASRSG